MITHKAHTVTNKLAITLLAEEVVGSMLVVDVPSPPVVISVVAAVVLSVPVVDARKELGTQQPFIQVVSPPHSGQVASSNRLPEK
jgi:hypothetical protein